MTIETDYLIVGAGASGMAFADALVARSDADVVLVDRRHNPGGHWNDDYKFVRLHQPSAYYGVDSLQLGEDRFDTAGANAGSYERATGSEVCSYYTRVLADRLLPTARVRFVGMAEYRGGSGDEHTVTSLLTGATTAVRVRRRLVDATYIATTIPSRHKPSFIVEPGARLIPPNELVRLADPASSFTVIGAGKTAMDTCCWLMENGVEPGSIRWIRPHDPYVINRKWVQPLAHMASTSGWLARQAHAAGIATDPRDLLRQLEDHDVFQRLDPNVEPTEFRGATLSDAEFETLARIKDVVRLGHVRRIGVNRIELEDGSISTSSDEVHIDCTASGLGLPPPRPVFEADRITIQRLQSNIDPFSATLIGVVEASQRTDDDKNRLCPPNALTGRAIDQARELLATMRAQASWFGEPDLSEWLSKTRLTPFRDAGKYMDDAARAWMVEMAGNLPKAIENLKRIVAENPG